MSCIPVTHLHIYRISLAKFMLSYCSKIITTIENKYVTKNMLTNILNTFRCKQRYLQIQAHALLLASSSRALGMQLGLMTYYLILHLFHYCLREILHPVLVPPAFQKDLTEI